MMMITIIRWGRRSHLESWILLRDVGSLRVKQHQQQHARNASDQTAETGTGMRDGRKKGNIPGIFPGLRCSISDLNEIAAITCHRTNIGFSDFFSALLGGGCDGSPHLYSDVSSASTNTRARESGRWNSKEGSKENGWRNEGGEEEDSRVVTHRINYPAEIMLLAIDVLRRRCLA